MNYAISQSIQILSKIFLENGVETLSSLPI